MRNSDSLTRELEIVNRLGLHARAAAKLVTLASGFEADILLSKDSREVNAKSIMGVMMLAAAKGARVVVTSSGDDAEKAMESIAELIEGRFGEPE